MQAPPTTSPVQTPPGRAFRVPRQPLYPILFALVIAVGSGLVALLLLPLVGTLGVSVNAMNDRLNAAANGVRITIPHFPERSTIYAGDGSVLATIYLDENRQIVRLDQISQVARDAVIAIEDDGFYRHGAVNLPSIVRAFIANWHAGDITQGASTITQQLVKNAIIENTSQTYSRKFQEAALAIRMEHRYTKDQILEMYLNDVFFGRDVYGIGTAARYYFREPASKLSLTQAALLAGMIQAPNTYDPIAHPKLAKLRRDEVLDRMATVGDITPDRAAKAKAEPLGLPKGAGSTTQRQQPFFVHYIVQSILDDTDHEFDAFGKTYEQRRRTLYQGGLRIYTTLDPTWQRDAQRAVDASPNIHQHGGPDTSLVSVDAKTGAIRAMLSGKNYRRDQLDLAWQGRRQVGSAFKPFTLVAALQEGIPPGSVFSTRSPFCSPQWTSKDHCVSNAEGGDRGYVNLWTATQDSINVVFAQLALEVGPSKIVDAAHAMGITAPLDAVPSITLGTEEVSTLDMASAYSTLANQGVHCQPFAISRVLLPGGKKLYQHKAACKRVIDPDIANQVTAMLRNVICCGTGTAANIPGRQLAGKTGTAQDYTNAYFAGYTPQIATAVWVGFPQGQIPMDSYFGFPAFGGTVTAPIWRSFMVEALAGLPHASFPAPPAARRGRIPDMVGMRSADAQRALQQAHFTPIVRKVDSFQPVNTVIRQSPDAGTSALLGSGVQLFVSNGKGKPVAVPRVVDLPAADAVKALKAAGLKPKIVYQDVTDPKQDGIVVAQQPIGGKTVEQGSVVTLWVGRKAAGPG